MIFEILKKSKLRTLGLWENNVSSVTGTYATVSLRFLSVLRKKSQLSFAVHIG